MPPYRKATTTVALNAKSLRHLTLKLALYSNMFLLMLQVMTRGDVVLLRLGIVLLRLAVIWLRADTVTL